MPHWITCATLWHTIRPTTEARNEPGAAVALNSREAQRIIGAAWTELVVRLARQGRPDQFLRAARQAMHYDMVGFVARGFAPLVRGG